MTGFPDTDIGCIHRLIGDGAHKGSAVLKIELPDNVVDAAVYSRGRKIAAPVDQDANAHSQAHKHQQALDRNADVFTQITLNKDGVLVARPRPVQEFAAKLNVFA